MRAHHRDSRVRPHPQQAWVVRASAHPVVARAERAADDDREFRDDRVRHGVHHLRAVLRDAGALVLAADDEPGDVLQKDQRHAAQIAQLHEVCRFERRFREQHAVVCDDAHQKPVQPREAGDERGAVPLFELVEA